MRVKLILLEKIPILTRDSLTKMTVAKLKEICSKYNILHGNIHNIH